MVVFFILYRRVTDWIQVVPRASAVITGVADAKPIAIPADHLNMVKMSSSEDEGYGKLSGHLWLLAEEAPGAISVRWAEQENINEAHQGSILLTTRSSHLKIGYVKNVVGQESGICYRK